MRNCVVETFFFIQFFFVLIAAVKSSKAPTLLLRAISLANIAGGEAQRNVSPSTYVVV